MARGGATTQHMTGDLVLARPGWRMAVNASGPVFVMAALFAYGMALGASGRWLAGYAGLLLLTLGPLMVNSVIIVLAQRTGGPSRLAKDGIRMRVRPWHRRLVTVPWSEIMLVWIQYVGRRRYLRLEADPSGPHADEWDPRGRRFSRRSAPLAVYVPESIGPEQVRAAVAALSDGTVTLADWAPDTPAVSDDGWALPPVTERRRALLPLSAPILLAMVLLGIPSLLRVAPPWNQPWWPGVTAAVRLPNACDAFTDEQARTLGITGHRQTSNRPQRNACRFTVSQGQLTVSIKAHHAFFGSNTANAGSELGELAAAMGRFGEPLPGVGDEAWLAANPQGTTTLFDRSVVDVAARRANVVLVIAYGGEQQPAAARPAVVDAARTMLAHLDVH